MNTDFEVNVSQKKDTLAGQPGRISPELQPISQQAQLMLFGRASP